MTLELPSNFQGPTIYSSLIAQARFHLTTNSVSNRLLAAPVISGAEALALNIYFDGWSASLPEYLCVGFQGPSDTQWVRFARHKLAWRCWNLQIILFRPVLLRCLMKKVDKAEDEKPSAEEQKCTELCLQCVHKTITSIEQYLIDGDFGRLAAWYAL